MTVEVVYGESRNRPAAAALADVIRGAVNEGTLYLGYPVIGSADEIVEVDALLLSKELGLVAFAIPTVAPERQGEWLQLQDEQDELFVALRTYLGRRPGLRLRRELVVQVRTVTIFPSHLEVPGDIQGDFLGLEELPGYLQHRADLSDHYYAALEAAIQHITTIKPRKRREEVTKPDSRGTKLKQIEREVANLDRYQKRAAIETPPGAQRIRGLAGSGKTVVLALKAAYLYTQHPDWTIVLTFQTRALYQQITDLTKRFTLDAINDEPDENRLRVIHAWGSASTDGAYVLMARALGLVPRDFNYARANFGMDNAFAGICGELLEVAQDREITPLFDAVLVDEAQDLPPEFFQLLRRFTRVPHRVTWAYDELQKLSEAVMPDTAELFGLDASGAPLISLTNRDGEARQDVVLPVCYRNTPWALTMAHALGLGIYREQGLVQHFDDPGLWDEIGYHRVAGELSSGHEVTLERAATSYPTYFTELLEPEDSVAFHNFDNEVNQDVWIAQAVKRNLDEDELEPDDILIVLPDTYTAKRRAPRLSRYLSANGIRSHLVGVASSVDEIFVRGSVAISHIYRAKGNEAPMVYVPDAQWAEGGANLITKRNVLFTAITRSRAWVRVCGYGPGMRALLSEADQVRNHGYRLEFQVPTPPELRQMRRLNRDRTREEAQQLERTTTSLVETLAALESKDVDLEDLPETLRQRLLHQLLAAEIDDADV